MKKVFIFAVLGLLISSAFANVDFYGSARLGYWYQMMDKDMTGGESRINMQFSLNSTSKLGADFDFDKFMGKTEFGFGNNVYLRLLYGKLDLGNLSLLVGQDYTGFNLANSACQNTSILLGYENMLIGYGAAYDGRQPMIKVIMNNGLYFSFTNPRKIDAIGLGTGAIDAIIPKINLGFNFKNDNLELYPTLGFNMSKYNKDFNGAGRDESVMAYVFATTFKIKLQNLIVKGQVNYGQNENNYGITTSTVANAGWDQAKEKIINATTLGGYLQLCYALGNNKIKFGGGYITTSADYLNDADTGMSVFLQGNFSLHKNVSLVPEVGLFNNMEDGYGNKEGSEIYFGTKLQMDF